MRGIQKRMNLPQREGLSTQADLLGVASQMGYLPEVSCPSGQRQSPQGGRWPGGEDGELCALAARLPGRGPLRATGANVSSANTCLQIGARGAGSGLSGWHRKAHFLSEQTSVLGGDVPGRVNLACLYFEDYPFPSDAGGRPHFPRLKPPSTRWRLTRPPTLCTRPPW